MAATSALALIIHTLNAGDSDMKKGLHLNVEFFPRKWPCFAVGFFSGGNEFALHLYVVCFRIRWGF